jgi:uncharacterized membrane protein
MVLPFAEYVLFSFKVMSVNLSHRNSSDAVFLFLPVCNYLFINIYFHTYKRYFALQR